MNKQIDACFDRVEKALGTLIDSIAKYNPSTNQVLELGNADVELTRGLKERTSSSPIIPSHHPVPSFGRSFGEVTRSTKSEEEKEGGKGKEERKRKMKEENKKRSLLANDHKQQYRRTNRTTSGSKICEPRQPDTTPRSKTRSASSRTRGRSSSTPPPPYSPTVPTTTSSTMSCSATRAASARPPSRPSVP